jgi:hypothetical protein
MEIEARELIELNVLKALKSVRLVFELGFPDVLVSEATEVVRDCGPALVTHGRPRYPACFVLHIVNLAKDRNGREFWSSDDLAHLCRPLGMNPQQLAVFTRDAIKAVGLETFEHLVEEDNALRFMTPVTMHSGIPIRNVDDLLRIVQTAIRRHRHTPDEQIRFWNSSPNGYAGVWAAPRRLLKEADSIALDLLGEINEVLLDPDYSGITRLPKHLAQAVLEVSPHQGDSSSRTSQLIPKPWIEIDPYSCSGPVLVLPPVEEAQLSSWRVTNAVGTDFLVNYSESIETSIRQASDYEISAQDELGRIVSTRVIRAYSGFPAYFFSATTNRLLSEVNGRVDVVDSLVLALVHPKTSVISGGSFANDLPARVDEWVDWRFIEIDTRTTKWLVLGDRTKSESESAVEIEFRRGSSPISISESNISKTLVRHSGGRVYDEPPVLRIELGEVNPDLVNVEVIGFQSRRVPLSHLPISRDECDISSLFDGDGTYSIEVHGPIGMRMKPLAIVLVRELSIEQDPPIALPGEVINLEVSSMSSEVDLTISDGVDSVNVTLGFAALEISPVRFRWNISMGGKSFTEVGQKQFELSLNYLLSAHSVLLNLRTGIRSDLVVSLQTYEEEISRYQVVARGGRWSFDLSVFVDAIEKNINEEFFVVVKLGVSEEITVGRIVSEYVAKISMKERDKSISPSLLEVNIDENRPFNSRVLRIWNLDRPWEKSFLLMLSDNQRQHFEIVMPQGHRSGRYRAWLRVESSSVLEPDLPNHGASSVCDFTLQSGVDFDSEDAVDRIIQAVTSGSLDRIRSGDVKGNGEVLIALLARNVADHNGRALTERDFAIIYQLLTSEPEGIVGFVAKALSKQVIDERDKIAVSLSLLPVLFEAEDSINLSIDPEDSELVWSQLPILACAVEPWSESIETQCRWSEKLGWPKVPDSGISLKLNESSDVKKFPSRAILALDFDQQLRRVVEFPAEVLLAALGQFIGIRDGQPLSVDAEWDAIVMSILDVFPKESEVSLWRRRYESVVSRAHRNVKTYRNQEIFTQYAAKAVWKSDPQYKWFLNDIAVLAYDGIHARSESLVHMQALIDGVRIAPKWVTYAVLLALSMFPSQVG